VSLPLIVQAVQQKKENLLVSTRSAHARTRKQLTNPDANKSETKPTQTQITLFAGNGIQ
jgi:hypothetical protein